jgi:hypothetical protein
MREAEHNARDVGERKPLAVACGGADASVFRF